MLSRHVLQSLSPEPSSPLMLKQNLWLQIEAGHVLTNVLIFSGISAWMFLEKVYFKKKKG